MNKEEIKEMIEELQKVNDYQNSVKEEFRMNKKLFNQYCEIEGEIFARNEVIYMLKEKLEKLEGK